MSKKIDYDIEKYIAELDAVKTKADGENNAALLMKVIEAKGKAFGFDKYSVNEKLEAEKNPPKVTQLSLFDKIDKHAALFKKLCQRHDLR